MPKLLLLRGSATLEASLSGSQSVELGKLMLRLALRKNSGSASQALLNHLLFISTQGSHFRNMLCGRRALAQNSLAQLHPMLQQCVIGWFASVVPWDLVRWVCEGECDGRSRLRFLAEHPRPQSSLPGQEQMFDTVHTVFSRYDVAHCCLVSMGC